MKKFLLISFLLVSSFLSSKELDLKSSINMALQNNLEISAEENALKSSQWGKVNALTNFLPQVAFNSTTVHIDDDTFDASQEVMQIPVLDGTTGMPNGNYIPFSGGAMGGGIYQTLIQNKLTISQPIFNGGKVILAYQMAKKATELSNLKLADKVNDIVYRVAFAHFGILKLNELKGVYEAKVSADEAHLAVAINQYNAGIVMQNEVLRWKVELSKAKIELDEIENSITIALDNWRNLLGAETDIFPSEIDITKFDEKILEISELGNIANYTEKFLSEVKQNNPNIKCLAISTAIVQKQYTMAKGEFLPSLNLQYSYQLENDDKFDFKGDDNWNIAAVVSMPIFTSGKNYSNAKRAKYEVKKAKVNAQATEDSIILAAKNSLMIMITSAKKVHNSKISLDLVEENFKVINKMYEQGMVKGDDLLDAETMRTASKLELVSAYYDFILANYELRKWTNN